MKKLLLTTPIMIMVGILLFFSIPAFAAANASNAQATSFSTKADCGSSNTNFTPIGFVNFHRLDNTVAVNYHLKSAKPDTTYSVSLWTNTPFCTFLATIGSVTTNSNGVGNGNFETTVSPTSTLFFATSFATTGPFAFNDTTTVTLPAQ